MDIHTLDPWTAAFHTPHGDVFRRFLIICRVRGPWGVGRHAILPYWFGCVGSWLKLIGAIIVSYELLRTECGGVDSVLEILDLDLDIVMVASRQNTVAKA